MFEILKKKKKRIFTCPGFHLMTRSNPAVDTRGYSWCPEQH